MFIVVVIKGIIDVVHNVMSCFVFGIFMEDIWMLLCFLSNI